MKILTKYAVELTATLLVHTNGTTTTLDVKKLLRELGYKATQQEVSDFMNEVYDEIQLTRNGYHVYSFNSKTIDIAEDEATASITSITTGAPLLQAIDSHDPLFIYYTEDAMLRETTIDTDTDKWVAYSPNAYEYHVYFNCLSRDNVRSRYASLLKLPIQQVRACRIKNYVIA